MKYTIKNNVTFQQKIQKSTFIGHLSHITNVDSAKQFFHEINKKNTQATHNCPAYILGKNGETVFCSDAGEPSGTAGKPILNMLHSHELTNIAIVITRYFGGVKLGVRGLIDAYGGTAEQTILIGEKEPVIDYFQYKCIIPYNFFDIFTHKIQIPDVSIIKTEYSEKIEITISVTEFAQKEFEILLNELNINWYGL